MNDVQETIEQLNLKPLNVLSNTKLTHETTKNGIEKWSCETQIANIECVIEIFSEKEYIQLYILPDITCDSTTLAKVNEVNLKNWGCGISCYIDNDSNSIALKTSMLDYTINSKETIIKVLNNSIPSAIQVIKALIS